MKRAGSQSTKLRASAASAVLVAQAAFASFTVVIALPVGLTEPALAHGGNDSFMASGAIYTVAWSKDGSRFAAGTDSGNITIYDGLLHFETARWHAHNGPINQVAFSPDGMKIASVSGAYRGIGSEKALKVFNLTGSLLLNISDHYDWVTSVAWSPDGRLIASSSGVDNHEDPTKVYGEVKFWDSATGTLVWNATAHMPEFGENQSYPSRMAWAPDGHAVAALGHLNDLWLLYPDERPRRMEQINHSYRDVIGHASHGWAVEWSPNSQLIVAGFSYDFTRPSAQSSDFLPDGVTDSGPVIVFDPSRKNEDGFATQSLRAEIHTKPAEWVTWDSTGKWIASCSGADLLNTSTGFALAGQDGRVDAGELVIYDVAASRGGRLKAETVVLFGQSWCSSAAFRPGNETILAGNADSSLKLYVFDYDGDGCNFWVDAAPNDGAICAVAPPGFGAFLDQWALPLVLAVGAAGAVAAIAFMRRQTAYDIPERDRGRRGGSGARRRR